MNRIFILLAGMALLASAAAAQDSAIRYGVATKASVLLQDLSAAGQAESWLRRLQEIDGGIGLQSFRLFKQDVIPFIDRGRFKPDALQQSGRTQLLCYSPDGTKAVDLFGGMHLVKKGKRWAAGYGVDGGFVLYDFAVRTSYQLLALGPLETADEGFWLAPDCFVALGKWRLRADGNVTPAIFVFFLTEHRYAVYAGPELDGQLFRRKWNGLKFLSMKYPAIDF